MRAEPINFIDELFDNNNTYLIPCYQRPYAWQESDCDLLWNDICDLMTHPNIKEHFIGTIILFDVENDENNNDKKYWIIDGQQRITTIYVLLKALYDIVVNDSNGALLAANLKPFLYNFSHLKLIPKENDIDILQDIFFHPNECTANSDLYCAYCYFQKAISDFCIRNQQYDQVFKAISKLTAVREIFALSDNEDPHAVFEHVNADRDELTLTDKVRNFLLLSDKYAVARNLYTHIWRPMEDMFIDHFDDADRQKMLDDYVFKFLQLKIPGISLNNAYEKFRIYLTEQIIKQDQSAVQAKSTVNIDNLANSSNNDSSIFTNNANEFNSFQEDNDEEENEEEPMSVADDIRLDWLKQLSYYSYFYVVFSCKFFDNNNLSTGKKEGKLGSEPFQHVYHAYSWNIRVILYWFRMLHTSSPYVLFFKLFEWEDKNIISQLTLEKVIFLMLNYTIRYAIIDQHNRCPSDSAYDHILSTIYFQNKIKEENINDGNCYDYFISYFKNYVNIKSEQDFFNNATVANAIKAIVISGNSHPNLFAILFLLMYYKTFLFSEDKFYWKEFHLIYILPNTNIDEFEGKSWLSKDDKNEWNGFTKLELNQLLKYDADKFGNIGIIDEKIWDKVKKVTKDKGKTNHVIWFFLPGNDFCQKKRTIGCSIFADSSYQIMLESKNWNEEAIDKRTSKLATKIIECLPNLIGENNESKTNIID